MFKKIAKIAIIVGATIGLILTLENFKPKFYTDLIYSINYDIQTSEELIASKKDALVLVTVYKSPNQVATGTGFFIEENLILTNRHVIEDVIEYNQKAETTEETIEEVRLRITSSQSLKEYKAEVLVSDIATDVALLKITEWKDYSNENTYQILEINDDVHELNTGQPIYTYGHSLQQNWSLSKGIVSNEHRRNIRLSPATFIQIDANVFFGNSGGPLLNERGEVIGLNTFFRAMRGGSIGFAIRSDFLRKIIDDLLVYGTTNWPIIGIALTREDETSLYFSVKKLRPDGLAEKNGILVGDKLLTINGVDVRKFNIGQSIIMSSGIGDSLFFTVLRGEEIVSVELVITEEDVITSEELNEFFRYEEGRQQQITDDKLKDFFDQE